MHPFTDDELRSRTMTIKIPAGLHAALRELAPKLMEDTQTPSLNAALSAALHGLVTPRRRQLKARTRDLMLLTGPALPRKGTVG